MDVMGGIFQKINLPGDTYSRFDSMQIYNVITLIQKLKGSYLKFEVKFLYNLQLNLKNLLHLLLFLNC